MRIRIACVMLTAGLLAGGNLLTRAAEEISNGPAASIPVAHDEAPAAVVSTNATPLPGATLPVPPQDTGSVSALISPPAATPEVETSGEPAWTGVSRSMELLTARLAALEETLLAQQRRSMQAGESATRTVLVVAGCFAMAVLLGILIAALILARAMQRFSEVVVTAGPLGRQLSPGAGLPALAGGGDLSLSMSGPALDQVTSRFLGAVEQLEKRIVELEHSGRSAGRELGSGQSGNGASAGREMEFRVRALQDKQYAGGDSAAAAIADTDPVGLWLGKGQALLNLGQADEALACFDKAIEANPKLAEAHVKRGMALERLQRMEAALESYDLAIAADAKMTLAYLYKGAVCNRLQRFREALECYENALRSEQHQVSA